MRSTALDDPFVFLFQAFQGGNQFIHSGEQIVFDCNHRRDMHSRRERVVRALALIDVVVGVQNLCARDLVATVCNHFVRVHIRLRTATRLPNDEREMGVEFTRNHFVARQANRIFLFLGNLAKVVICKRCRFFQNAERTRDFTRHNLVANAEILITSLRLRRPVSICGDLHFPHRVFFNTVFHLSYLR